jgi:hypothetical protein
MRQNDGMQLLPENLPFYCCSMCLVVFKTYREFEAHVCKNGGSSVDEETTMVSSLPFYDELILALARGTYFLHHLGSLLLQDCTELSQNAVIFILTAMTT